MTDDQQRTADEAAPQPEPFDPEPLDPEPLDIDVQDVVDALPHGDNPHPPSESGVQVPG